MPLTVYKAPAPRAKPEPVCHALAAAIRQRLDTSKMSLDRLAELTGLSRPMIRSIQSNRHGPTIDALARISRAFGVPCSKRMVEAEIELRLQLPRRKSVDRKSSAARG